MSFSLFYLLFIHWGELAVLQSLSAAKAKTTLQDEQSLGSLQDGLNALLIAEVSMKNNFRIIVSCIFYRITTENKKYFFLDISFSLLFSPFVHFVDVEIKGL